MRSLILSTAMLAALAGSAAGQPPPDRRPPGTTSARATLTPDPKGTAADPESAVDWLRIGVLDRGVDRCPEVHGWYTEAWLSHALIEPRDESLDPTVLRQGAAALDPRAADSALAELRRLGLDRLCLYRAGPGSFPPFQPPAGLARQARDRMAVAPTGGPPLGRVGEQAWRLLATELLAQAGKSADLPIAGPPKVRLVFIDTQPDGEQVPNQPGKSLHGYTLANLANRLVCRGTDLGASGGRDCAAKVVTRLALAYDSSPAVPADPNFTYGGNVGLVNELAAAIVREVWEWRLAGSRQRLVLNLSLGWDGEQLGDLGPRDVSRLDPPVQAVYNAVRFARRSGALVVAAAGNRRGGPKPSTEPLLPAAWELRRPSPWPRLLLFGRKPLWAVGGVDWQGLPLPNSRDGGRPRRVAYGDHAVVAAVTGEPTAIYTGTSVSAAVTSSIAAVVWHLRPELSARQVMQLLTRAGGRLPSRADSYRWRPLSPVVSAPRMRRLALCPAVARACGPHVKSCPAAPRCPEWKREAADLSGIAQSLGFVPHTMVFETAALPQVCATASHPPPELWRAVGKKTTLNACPLAVLADMTTSKLVLPQPEATPCPGCTLIPKSGTGGLAASADGYDLAMEISPTWKAMIPEQVNITSAALDVDLYSGGKFVERKTFVIPDAVLTEFESMPSTFHLLEGAFNGASLRDCTATVNFEVVWKKIDDTWTPRSVQSPVYVDP